MGALAQRSCCGSILILIERNSVQPPPYKQWFTSKGFEKAKDYYERLILQYPYSKSRLHSLGHLHLYPAMYGLWISIAQEESRAAREANPDDEDEDEDDADSPRELEYPFNIGDVDVASRRRHEGRTIKICSACACELAEAEIIAIELDKVLLSPPYSDSPRLSKLRGMMAQWIGDLYVFSVTADDPDNMPMPVDDVQSSLDHRLALERREREIMKAEALFEKARKRGKKWGAFQ